MPPQSLEGGESRSAMSLQRQSAMKDESEQVVWSMERAGFRAPIELK